MDEPRDEDVELVDLGDAAELTRGVAPIAPLPDFTNPPTYDYMG